MLLFPSFGMLLVISIFLVFLPQNWAGLGAVAAFTLLCVALSRLPLRLIGIVFDTYIILEYQDRMLLCDQHAVHERLLYERMMKACAGDTAAQGLLTPVLVRLTHCEYEAFLENGEALRAAGFDAADFGDLTVQLRAVPMVLGVARTTGRSARKSVPTVSSRWPASML